MLLIREFKFVHNTCEIKLFRFIDLRLTELYDHVFSITSIWALVGVEYTRQESQKIIHEKQICQLVNECVLYGDHRLI